MVNEGAGGHWVPSRGTGLVSHRIDLLGLNSGPLQQTPLTSELLLALHSPSSPFSLLSSLLPSPPLPLARSLSFHFFSPLSPYLPLSPAGITAFATSNGCLPYFRGRCTRFLLVENALQRGQGACWESARRRSATSLAWLAETCPVRQGEDGTDPPSRLPASASQPYQAKPRPPTHMRTTRTTAPSQPRFPHRPLFSSPSWVSMANTSPSDAP